MTEKSPGLRPPHCSFLHKQKTNYTTSLIARADGKFWNKDAWKDPFKAAAKAAGLPDAAPAYNLRHSAITDLIGLHRLDTMTVARLSGTSVSMIDKHYGHLHPCSALPKRKWLIPLETDFKTQTIKRAWRGLMGLVVMTMTNMPPLYNKT